MPNVLIVDDSPTAREILSAILSRDPDVEVVGFAKNGREAVERAKELRPDIITMDINMPVMNGLEATQEIMIETPTPIVIVSSTTRAREVDTSMQALKAGALTVLQKPLGPRVPEFQSLADEILSTVKSMSEVIVIRRRRKPDPQESEVTSSEVHHSQPTSTLRAIGIVASTGGPPALAKVLGQLPADFPVPILLVQHIVPSFLPGFASWLDSVVELNVKVACDNEVLEPGSVYVAPVDRHLGVTKNHRVRLSDDAKIGGFRPSGSYLLSSLADALGKNVVGLIMTGMGQDGVDGMQRMRERGGHTVAQDEASCVIFGMPRIAIERQTIATVLSLDAIGSHLEEMAAAAIEENP